MRAAVEEWIDRAKAASLDDALAILNIKAPRRGEYQGPCPMCGGQDRFSANLKKGVWNCRGAKGGGDAIGLIMHAQGVDFMGACEILNGEPAPRAESRLRERDPAIDKERREERRDAEIERARAEKAEKEKAQNQAEALWSRRVSAFGTVAEDYLARRGIDMRAFPHADVGLIPNLPYHGYADPDATETVELGAFHCMVAAMRDKQGRVVGVHRTYLQADGQKLKPPGFGNMAKKMMGCAKGVLIMLDPPADTLAIAEGIETAMSWRMLALHGEISEQFAGVGLAAAASINNLCGQATGTVPHPHPPRNRPNATVANGDPDMDSSIFWVPDGVKRVILLGDGDSDPGETRARLKTAVNRFRRLGLEVVVHMAPEGMDWNDAWLKARADNERAAA